MIRHRHPHSGSALVITLLVIAVLAIIVVAFLQSMTLERQTARSYLNGYRAELAAKAAQVEATSELSRLMAENPYHGIGYLPGPGPAVANNPSTPIMPVLYGAPWADSASPAPSPTPHYLVSGKGEQLTPTATLDAKNSIALNRKNGDRNDDFAGWMGSPSQLDPATGKPIGPPTVDTYRECRAPWVYVLQDSTRPHQADPNSKDYNPYISRYAWWVEDETSKLDLLYAGNNSGSGGAFQPPLSENLAVTSDTTYEDKIARKPSDLDLGAIPILNGNPIEDSGDNRELIDYLTLARDHPKDARILGEGPAKFNTSEAAARFYTTLNSTSNELAGNGRRRININALVHNTTNASEIASDLDDIAFAISGTHIFQAGDRSNNGLFSSASDDVEALLPDFGERFWPRTESSFSSNASLFNSNKKLIYLTKIAANIRDYIDNDHNPTFVEWNGTNPRVITGIDSFNKDADPAPGRFPNLQNNALMPIAIGHEAIPYLVKCAFSVTYNKDKSLGVDQTFSFFNPSNKNFQAPSSTYLRCFDRLKWTAGGFGSFQMPSFYLDLSGVNFPAGQVVVITTSGGGSTDAPTTPASAWRPTGGKMFPPDANIHQGNASAYVASQRDTSYDVSTKFLWGDANGFFGGFAAVTLTSFTATNYTMNSGNAKVTRSNSMQGNDAVSHSGDARSINEPLTFNKTSGSKGSGPYQEQARFWDDTSLNLALPSNSYINPTLWPDYTRPLTNLADQSYAVVRDQPMTSVGEFGNIYDPYRRSAGSFIDYARAGGRTLRVGQSDDVIMGNASASLGIAQTIADLNKAADVSYVPRFTKDLASSKVWMNAAWRLTDVFDVIFKPQSTTGTSSGPKLDLTTRLVPPQATGKLNINSVMRDDGMALRALLRGFKYLASPYTDAKIGEKSLSETEINNIVKSIKAYITQNGPIIERGELSQILDANTSGAKISLFSNGTLGNVPMKDTLDRGREEIFRRLIEMLTTRSNSFTVYSMGQSLREQRGADGTYQPTVVGTATKAVTYRFDPVIKDETGSQISSTDPVDKATAFLPVPLYVHP